MLVCVSFSIIQDHIHRQETKENAPKHSETGRYNLNLFNKKKHLFLFSLVKIVFTVCRNKHVPVVVPYLCSDNLSFSSRCLTTCSVPAFNTSFFSSNHFCSLKQEHRCILSNLLSPHQHSKSWRFKKAITFKENLFKVSLSVSLLACEQERTNSSCEFSFCNCGSRKEKSFCK